MPRSGQRYHTIAQLHAPAAHEQVQECIHDTVGVVAVEHKELVEHAVNVRLASVAVAATNPAATATATAGAKVQLNTVITAARAATWR